MSGDRNENKIDKSDTCAISHKNQQKWIKRSLKKLKMWTLFDSRSNNQETEKIRT